MAQSKTTEIKNAIKSSALPPTAPTVNEPAKFHLNRMPPELVHMICKYLTPTQIASIRLMSSMIAAIGLEYIATTVTLTLKEASFDRLLEIAHHPVIGNFVYDLHYEHDFLDCVDRREWEGRIRTPEYMAALLTKSENRGTSLRALRKLYQPLEAFDKYGKKTLDKAYLTYQMRYAEQDCVRKSNFFHEKLTDALQHLPNLKTIDVRKHRRYQVDGFLQARNGPYSSLCATEDLIGSFYDQSMMQYASVSMMRSDIIAITRSVLLALDQALRGGRNRVTEAGKVGCEAALRAGSRRSISPSRADRMDNNRVTATLAGGTTMHGYLGQNFTGSSNRRVVGIKALTSESFNWMLLLEGDEVAAAMKRSISHLTKLDINVVDGHWFDDRHWLHQLDDKPPWFRDYIGARDLHEFVSSAPGLEELSVSFRANDHFDSVNLMVDVVGSFHWTFLKIVHFQRITITIDSLEDFCSRHSATLSNISLGDLQIRVLLPDQERDSWDSMVYSMFTKIREVTRLKKASVYGVFKHYERFNMDDHADVRCTSGALIGRYLVGDGGNSSLKNFLTEERSRIAEQEADPSINYTDDVSSTSEFLSESENSSSESVA